MDRYSDFLLMFALGLILGLFFFAGLWWTIRRGLNSKQPALWFISSMALRTGTILFGFYFVAHRGASDLVFCLAGFFISSLFVTWSTRLPTRKQLLISSDAQNAP